VYSYILNFSIPDRHRDSKIQDQPVKRFGSSVCVMQGTGL
jgi:hypothetical protein